MNMNRKGSVSLLLLIIFPALLLLGVFFTETARYRAGQLFLEQALQSTARSSIGHYDRRIFRDYGLLVVDTLDQETVEKLFLENLDNNGLLNMQIEKIWWEPVQWISQEEVILPQILETVKYSGPLNMSRSLGRIFQGFHSARDFSQAGEKAVLLDQANQNMDEIGDNNREISDLQDDARSINGRIREERNRAEPNQERIERLQRQASRRREEIDVLYDRNQTLVLEVDDLLGQAGEPSLPSEDALEGIDPRQWLEKQINETAGARERLVEKTGMDDLEEMLPRQRPDNLTGDTGKEMVHLLDQLRTLVLEGRDEMYLGEYVLTHLSHLNHPISGRSRIRTEAEYVITGAEHPQILYLLQLLGVRIALNTVGYFAFSPPPAPVGPVSRVVYSLLLGAWEGALDVFRMIGAEDRVPIINMTPSLRNPLRNVQVDYEDHLRISLLLVERQDKIKRILDLVDVSGVTGIRMGAEVSMPVLFAGGEWLPGSQIRDERIYFTKELEICY